MWQEEGGVVSKAREGLGCAGGGFSFFKIQFDAKRRAVGSLAFFFFNNGWIRGRGDGINFTRGFFGLRCLWSSFVRA